MWGIRWPAVRSIGDSGLLSQLHEGETAERSAGAACSSQGRVKMWTWQRLPICEDGGQQGCWQSSRIHESSLRDAAKTDGGLKSTQKSEFALIRHVNTWLYHNMSCSKSWRHRGVMTKGLMFAILCDGVVAEAHEHSAAMQNIENKCSKIMKRETKPV